MKKRILIIILGLGFIASVASAAPTSTIIQSLIISNLKNSGVLCLHVNNSGYVSTSTADCGSGSGFTTTTIAGLTSTTFNLFATTTQGISTSSPNNIYIGPGATYLTAALTSLNGSTSSTQTFATSTASNTFRIATLDGVHTLTIPSNVSFFTNDAGYATSSLVSGYLQGGVNNLIASTSFSANSSSSTPLNINATTTQNADIFRVNGTTTDPIFIVDKSATIWVGKGKSYTASGQTYADSFKLGFDSIGAGSSRTAYINLTPQSPPSSEMLMNFVVNGSTQLQLGNPAGVNFPSGLLTSGGQMVLGGNTIRSGGGAANLTLRGENAPIVVQGERNTASDYDVKLIGKSFFGGSSVGRLAGFYNDSTVMAYVDTYGGAVFNNSATSSAAADVQIKSATNANLFRAVASTSRIGIGTSTPSALLHISGATSTQAAMRIDQGAAPTSPNDGDHWNDAAQKANQAFVDGIKQSLSGTIFTATAASTVTNTVSDTSAIPTGVGTTTLPANFFVPGKTVHLHGGGIYALPLTGGTATVKIKYGATTLASQSTTGLLANVPNQRFVFDAYVTCRTAGASGSLIVDGNISYSSNSATNVYVQDPLNNSGAATTVDTTAAGTLDVTAAFDTAATTKAATTTVASYEVLN